MMKKVLLVWMILELVTAAQRPNIVVIVADDLGWNDISFHGSQQIPTPNIDALAYEGIILNNYYVSPICTPTRGALMSGRHPIHTGLQHSVIFASERYGLPLVEKIMPQYMQQLGYRTHMVGKWHLGFYAWPFTPTYRGFESHYGYLMGHGDYFDHMTECGSWHLGMFAKQYLPTMRGFESHYGYYQGCEDYYDHSYEANLEYWGLDWRRNLELIRNETNLYSTDLFTAEAVNIINKHNKSQPLFLYLPHQAVHSGNTDGDPLQAPQRYVDRFLHIKNYHRRLFAGMVAALDDSVGAIVKTLKDNGIYNNTVILFTTDNGGPANGFDANAANNFPLRGVKATLWEGGVRGVGFISSPLLKNRGYVSNQMIHVCDWLPTLYTAAGGDSSVMKDLDGFNVWNDLSNNRSVKRKEILHNIDPTGKNGFAGLRVEDYKILVGDVGMAWDDWYPPWQNPADSITLHVNNTHRNRKPNESLEYNLRSKTDKNVEYFNMEMGDNLGFELAGSMLETGSNNKHTENSLISYPHNGEPVKVDCGPKPFNASTNCDPRVAPCLFHIPSDPCEYNNIAAQNKDLVIKMLVRVFQYSMKMVPPLNTPVDPAGNPKYHDGAWIPWVKL